MYYVTKTVVDNTEDVLVGIGDTNDDSEEFYSVERVPYILSVTPVYGSTVDVAIGFDNYLYRRGHDTYRICLNQLYGDFDTKVQVLHNVDARVKSGVLNFLDLSFCDFSSLPIYSFCKELASFAVRSLTGKSDYRLCIDDSFTYRWNLFIGLRGYLRSYKIDISLVSDGVMLDEIYDDVFQCVLRTLDEEGKFNLTLYGTRYLDTLTSLDHILFLTKNLLYDTEDRMRLKALNFKRSLRNNKTMGRE